MTSYKELLMSRDAFLALRRRIDWALSSDEIDPVSVEFDKDSTDILVTWTHEGVERTDRLIMKAEAEDVPRETSPENPTEEHTPCP